MQPARFRAWQWTAVRPDWGARAAWRPGGGRWAGGSELAPDGGDGVAGVHEITSRKLTALVCQSKLCAQWLALEDMRRRLVSSWSTRRILLAKARTLPYSTR